MSTGFLKKLDPPHSFPFLTNTRAVLGKPIPFSQLPAPSDLSGNGTFRNSKLQSIISFNVKFTNNLILWLDANDSSTLTLTRWNDKSKNNYYAESVNDKRYDPYTFNLETYNENNLVYVNLINIYSFFINQFVIRYLEIPNFTMRPTFTMFAVLNVSRSSYFGVEHVIPLPDNPNADATRMMYLIDNFRALTFGDTAGEGLLDLRDTNLDQNDPYDNILKNTGRYILSIGYNLGNTISPYRLNGVNRQSTFTYDDYPDYLRTIPDNNYYQSKLRIYAGTDIYLGEFIMIDRNLPIEECQMMEGYLARKWNLNNKLPSDHPFRNKDAII